MLDSIARRHLTELLINVDTAALLDSLDAAQTYTELTTAWLPIVKNLCANYTVERDDNTKYAEMIAKNTISKLEPVVEYCIAQLDGRLSENAELANELIQLHFKVSSFYTLDGQHEKAFDWHHKNFAYITKQNLENTLSGTRFHNLLGADLARLFNSGLIDDFPPAARKHFEVALATHKDLGDTLDKSEQMRHIQMCLIICIIEEVTDKLIKSKIQLEAGKETATVTDLLATATDLTKELKPHIPENDLFRQARILQNEANIQALQNNLYDAINGGMKSVQLMEKHGLQAKASGQLSKLFVELARIHVMLAVKSYSEIISAMDYGAVILELYRTNGVKGVKPFVNSAKNELPDLLKHPYAQLYLTIAGEHEISAHLHTDPLIRSVNKSYVDAKLLDADPYGLQLYFSSFFEIKDYKLALKNARSVLMIAAWYYVHAATIQGPEQIYAEVAKRELGYLLSNPYVQSLKHKFPSLSSEQRDELFARPSEDLGIDLLFSGGPATEPKINFSNIVDLNEAQTAIKRSVPKATLQSGM